ncbi:MAG: class I SAM-dependent methyltransferase [Bacteroidales bacterium]
MEQETLDMLQCPLCGGELMSAADPPSGMTCLNCKTVFSGSEGYTDFLADKGLEFKGRREKIIRSLYAKTYTPVNNFLFLFCGGATNARNEVLTRLELRDNDRILETGMGAGENYPWMNGHAKGLKFYGIDIQKQMMVHCIRNIKKWGIKAEVFRADAHSLPFKDSSFDVVFHLGAINLFRDRKKAIGEMIRVSRPETRIVIADETDKASKLFNLFTGANDKVVPPFDLIPDSMHDKRIETIWRGYGYVMQFKKP